MVSEEYIENGYKLEIGRNRTHVTTYENMKLYTSHPTKEPDKKKIKPSVPSDYADHNYYLRIKYRRDSIKELAYNNFSYDIAVMVTLTFDRVMVELTEAHKLFYLFIKRVNDHYEDFKYLATFSRQANGNWHYHVLCNFDPKRIKNAEIKELWRSGITYITYRKDGAEFRDTVNYMISNMAEASSDTKGKRGYLASKNLEHNIVLKSYKSEDAEDFEKAFATVQSSTNKILYETHNTIGIKGTGVNEETGEVQDVRIAGVELSEIYENAGYENWDTTYTHVASSARFPEMFKPLTVATKKQKKFKRKSYMDWNLDEAGGLEELMSAK